MIIGSIHQEDIITLNFQIHRQKLTNSNGEVEKSTVIVWDFSQTSLLEVGWTTK